MWDMLQNKKVKRLVSERRILSIQRSSENRTINPSYNTILATMAAKVKANTAFDAYEKWIKNIATVLIRRVHDHEMV